MAAVSARDFGDSTGAMGDVAYELGNVYRGPVALFNGTLLFWALQLPCHQLLTFAGRHGRKDIDDQRRAFSDVLPEINRAIAPLQEARMVRHAAQRGLLATEAPGAETSGLKQKLADDLQEIIHAYSTIWLGRNRQGALRDSVAYFEQALKDYIL